MNLGMFEMLASKKKKKKNVVNVAARHVAPVEAFHCRRAVRGDDRRRVRPATKPRVRHVAKAAAGEAARRIVKDGVQIHGGIGYTWEHDLHLYLAAQRPPTSTCSARTGWHLDRIADLLMGAPES